MTTNEKCYEGYIFGYSPIRWKELLKMNPTPYHIYFVGRHWTNISPENILVVFDKLKEIDSNGEMTARAVRDWDFFDTFTAYENAAEHLINKDILWLARIIIEDWMISFNKMDEFWAKDDGRVVLSLYREGYLTYEQTQEYSHINSKWTRIIEQERIRRGD